MKTKTFKLFTNNLIYNCYAIDSDTQVKFLLPYGVLNNTSYIRSVITKDKDVILLPAEQLKIEVCLTVLSKTAPEVLIECENENSVIYGSEVKIEPEACQLLSFISYDSGYTWNVVNNVYGKVDVDKKLKELSDALSAEVTRATNIEQQIAADLYSETTRATNAEKALDTKVSAETTRATNAEKALGTRTTTLENAGYQTANNVKTILTNGNYVTDANYVHTDNNYTNEDKEKVNTINKTT